MGSTAERISALLIRRLGGTLREEERAELEEWMSRSAANRQAAEEFLVNRQLGSSLLDVFSKQAVWERIRGTVQETPEAPAAGRLRKLYPLRWWAAASLLLLLAVGAYRWWKPGIPAAHTAVQRMDVLPGGDKATLTLADGTLITLDSSGNRIIRQDAVAIRQQGGLLAYSAEADKPAISYHTLATPKGGQFRLTLPDGTKVWLNAASSIRYPTAFTGRERKVEITGEAYLEVATNPSMPFKVTIDEQTGITVLGTHFNVNAYADEPGITATLLEGAIRMTAAGEQRVLRPGEQALVADNRLSVKKVDVAQAVAWKNGYFSFRQADIPTVMRQLARWYDVEVSYANIPQQTFSGKIGRSLTLGQVLQGLTSTSINYAIKDSSRIIILP